MKLKLIAGAALAACMAFGSPALAQQHGDGHGHGGRFYGRSFHDFSPYELSIWRSGRWLHSWHAGVYGWWWFVDDGWYMYPEPIYPYPVYTPGADSYGPPPPPPQGPYGPPPSQVWYHCDTPDGYYPYVKTCKGPWTPVPATPPPQQAYGPGPENSAPPPPPQPYQPGQPR